MFAVGIERERPEIHVDSRTREHEFSSGEGSARVALRILGGTDGLIRSLAVGTNLDLPQRLRLALTTGENDPIARKPCIRSDVVEPLHPQIGAERGFARLAARGWSEP